MIENPQYFGRDLEALSFAVNYHHWIIDEFTPYFGKTIIEVGAGQGNVSKLLLKKNIEKLMIYEPSANMFPLLKENLKDDARIELQNKYLRNDYKNFTHTFDSVLYLNVLEHVEKDLEELKIVHSLLNDNGYVLIFVPALPFLYSKLDKHVGHFRRYKKKQLHDVVQKAGFSIVKSKYFDFMGVWAWFINFTLLNRPITGGNVSFYDKGIVPIMRKLENCCPPIIGKNILLVAQKKQA